MRIGTISRLVVQWQFLLASVDPTAGPAGPNVDAEEPFQALCALVYSFRKSID